NMLIEWDIKYETGIKAIDIQHKRLIMLTNQLHESIMEGKSYDTLDKIFQNLIDYTIKHFSDEERLLLIYDYPNYLDHKKYHSDLTNQMQELFIQFKTGMLPAASIKVKKFLLNWITDHILDNDMKYIQYVDADEIDSKFTDMLLDRVL
ncbi:hemerythrin family protein, partial [bacterium]|nr:hemerythrin family protein [bacterium]